MNLQLAADKQHSYETLPELLNDLRSLVTVNKVQWNAALECGGDSYSLTFSAGYQTYGYSNGGKEDAVTSTYESMDAFVTELNHIKEYLEEAEDEMGKTCLTYNVVANGGKPFMRLACGGCFPGPEPAPYVPYVPGFFKRNSYLLEEAKRTFAFSIPMMTTMMVGISLMKYFDLLQ